MPAPDALTIAVTPAASRTPAEREELLALCERAYDEEFGDYFEVIGQPTHVFARVAGVLVAHACWVTRWLQPDDKPLLRTAYVECVATEPALQGRGYASAVMRRVVAEVAGYDIAALSPTKPDFYARLGWEMWRGPLLIRTETDVEPAPAGEACMIYGLPKTPPLDLGDPLSIEWRPGGEVW